jgi:iron complex transport system substrate-binding protein
MEICRLRFAKRQQGTLMRIISLIASATEIVCALGFEKQLVGRSHECDYPDSVRRLPICTEPKFDVAGSSYEIDQRVKAIVQESLSVYRVDGQRLRDLEPDIIVAQAHCEVCAVSLREVERTVCAWLRKCPKLISLMPNSLADVWDDIERVAEALGQPERGVELNRYLQGRMDAIAEKARSLSPRPSVACIEWIEPLMAAGNWMPELVERAGGVNLFGAAGKHSPWLTWEQLVAADPDVIFLSPCGFDIARTRQELSLLTRKPEWSRLRAVSAGKVFVADGNAFFNRPGPRLVESLEILAEMLHPQQFAFGHEGTGWQRVEE